MGGESLRRFKRTLAVEPLEPRQMLTTVWFSGSSGSTEGNNVQAYVERDDPNGDLIVNYYISGGDASSGDDYTSPSGSVTILDGNTSAPIDISTNDDSWDESDESIELTLGSGDYDIGSTSQTSMYIQDNDDPPTVQLSVGIEGTSPFYESGPNSSLTFAINASAPVPSDVCVSYSFSGSATEGVDYYVSGSAYIVSGMSSTRITVTGIPDTDPNECETVEFSLSSGSGYSVDPNASSAVVTLLDALLPNTHVWVASDTAREAGAQPGAFRLQRDGDLSQPLTVHFGLSGSAIRGGALSDYSASHTDEITFGPGWQELWVDIAPVDDQRIEGPESVTLTITEDPSYLIATPSATLFIADDEAFSVSVAATDAAAAEWGNHPGVFTFSANAILAEDLPVYYRLTGTAINGPDYTYIPHATYLPGFGGVAVATIAAGTSSATVILQPRDDGNPEGDETVELSLLADGHSPHWYNLGASTATVTIADDVSVIDLDADSDHDGMLERDGNEEALELTSPGVYLDIAATPTRVPLAFDAVSCYGATGWTARLTCLDNAAGVVLWDAPYGGNVVVLGQVWSLEPDQLSQTLWVEGTALGTSQLTLTLYDDQHGLVGHDDVLVRGRLTAPDRLIAAAVSDTRIDLTWVDNATGESGYVVERMTATTPWAALPTLAANTTTYSDTGLTEGTAYYYRVRAVNESGTLAETDMAYAFTLPKAPTIVSVTFVNGGQASVTWQDRAAAEAGYSIEQRIDGQWEQVATTAAGSGTMNVAVAGAFAPSTVHSFRVRAYAYDYDDEPLYASSYAWGVMAPAWPAAPSELMVTPMSHTRVDLAWTDNAVNETGYKIERSADGLTGWTQIATAAANATSYSDTTVTEGEGTARFYRVRATRTGYGDSAYTAPGEATTLPATPTNLVATLVDGGQVNFTWEDNSAVETRYAIEQWVDDDWLDLSWVDADTESATVLGAFEPGTTPRFRVVALTETEDYNAASAPSNESQQTAGAWPLAPGELTTTVVSNEEIGLTWTDNAGNETSYTIERTTDGLTWTVVAAALPENTTSFPDTGLTDGTMYGYRVRAVNAAGGSGYTFNAAETLPVEPTNLQATVVSGTEIALSWDAAPYATGYKIWIQPQFAEEWTLIDTVADIQTSYTVTGLEAGGMCYAFCVLPATCVLPPKVAAGLRGIPTANTVPVIDGFQVADIPVTTSATITTTSATLKALVHDDQPFNELTYSWYCADEACYFGLNDSNAAQNSTVTFYRAGTYDIDLSVTDRGGLVSTRPIRLTVQQTQTTLKVTPARTAVVEGSGCTFTATALDQFGDPLQTQPAFAWTLNGSGICGTIDVTTGVYTAPSYNCTEQTLSVSVFGDCMPATAELALKKGHHSVVTLYGDAEPSTFQTVNLGGYEGITEIRIYVSAEVDIGIGYDDFSFQTMDGQPVTINFNELALGTCVREQYADYAYFVYSGNVVELGQNHERAFKSYPQFYSPVLMTFPQPVKNLSFNTIWAGTPKVGQYATIDIYSPQSRLVELGVHLPGYDGATAIDATSQYLEVPEDTVNIGGQSRPGAYVAIDASFFTVTGHARMGVTIDRSDGLHLLDKTYLSTHNFTQALPVTKDARDFVITTWVDSNANRELDPTEEKLIVRVKVVRPWATIGTWTAPTYGYQPAFVKANADGASLEQLAWAITGDRTDAVLLNAVGPITKDKVIDVSPLLWMLERRIREKIVEATQNSRLSSNVDFTLGNHGNPPGYSLVELKAAQINSLFDTSLNCNAKYDCHGVALAIFARGLIKGAALSDREFNTLRQTETDLNRFVKNISRERMVGLGNAIPLARLRDGDWADFNNPWGCPNPGWLGENVIKTGTDQYYGWDKGMHSYAEWRQILLDNYYPKNYVKPANFKKVTLADIRGYVGESRFFDIPKLAQKVFNMRTGQTP